MPIKPMHGICLYGNQKFRDKNCPLESAEQITFGNHVRAQYPETFGLILLHPKNEGQLINGQFSAVSKARAMGMAKGAADIIIPGNPAFVCEIKRADRTRSEISDEQIAYLYAAKSAGAFVCIALGHAAAIDAFENWLKAIKPPPYDF
jgi:hypothetical protein